MTDVRRALWICDYFPRPHNMIAGTWALESAIALREAGLPVTVLAPTPWIPQFAAATEELRQWSAVPRESRLRGVPVLYPRCPHYPRRWVREKLYSRFPSLDGSFLWPWLAGAVDRMMRGDRIDIVHANFVLPAGYIGMKLKERHGTALVVQERSVQRISMASQNRARARVYRRVLRAADCVITQNEKMAFALREMETGIRDLRVIKQPGMQLGRADSLARERPAAYRDRPVVLSVGTLSERKGHAILVRAIAEIAEDYPGLVCRIIGEGPEQARLEALINELELAHVIELLGRRSHEDVLGAMSWCDVFVLASWGEADGTVYGEAMQFEKPIIACRDEGIAEVVQDGVEGFLVQAGDVESLVVGLQTLLSDPARRKRMGTQARALAARELSYPGLADKLIGLYETVVAPRKASGFGP